MVRTEGLEPSRPYGQGILSPLRLPFRHVRGADAYSTSALSALAQRRRPDPAILQGRRRSNKVALAGVIKAVSLTPKPGSPIGPGALQSPRVQL
jgi:hypothetical protein